MKRKDIKELLEFEIYQLLSYLKAWKDEKACSEQNESNGFSKEYLASSIIDATGLIKRLLNKVKLSGKLALRAEKNIKEVYQLLEEDNSLSAMVLNGVNLDSFMQDFINYVQRYEQGKGDQDDMAETSRDFLIGRDTLERFLYVLEEANLSSEIKGEVKALRHNLSDIDNIIKDKLFCLYPAAPFAQEYVQRYEFTQEELEKYWWWKEVADLTDPLESLAKIAFKISTKEDLQPGFECLDENLMAAILDNTLLTEESGKVETHLRRCDYCLTRLRELRKETLRPERDVIPPAPSHMMERIEETENLRKALPYSIFIRTIAVAIWIQAMKKRGKLAASSLEEIEAEAEGEKVRLEVRIAKIKNGTFLLGLVAPEKYEGWVGEVWGILDGREEKMFTGKIEGCGIVFKEKLEGLENIVKDMEEELQILPENVKILLKKE